MSKIILDLCGGTGSWSLPYKKVGYDVINITLPDFDVRNVDIFDDSIFFNAKSGVALTVWKSSIYGILAAPPCTMFSIARNDKTAKEPRNLEQGLEIVDACLKIIRSCLLHPYRVSENGLKFWALENPHTGYLKRFLGNPPFVFDPSDFGDKHTKKTALWGMFNEPKKTNKVEVKGGDENNYVKSVERYFDDFKHLIPDNYRKDTGLSMRTVVRSITPQGFANAFYRANK